MSGAGLFTLAVLPDIHFHAGEAGATHDPRALSVTEQILADTRLDAVAQLGDAVDHEQIGRFSKDLPQRMVDGSLEEEWALARIGLNRLKKAARVKNPRARAYHLQGNHEARLAKFEGLHPQLRGLFDLPKQLGISDDGLATWVPSDSTGKVLRFVWSKDRPGCVIPRIVDPNDFDPFPEPGTTLLHGWSHGMNADKQTADMSPYPGLIVAGHSHRLQQKQAKRFGVGTSPTALILGTLSGLNPGYVQGKPTGWHQSIAIISMALGHPMVFQSQVIMITDGKAVHNGKLYLSKVKKEHA